jgi:hypothetical protein
MPIFTLGNVSFRPSNNPYFNSSESLIRGNYDYNFYKYPEDLGSMDKGHYIIIHINAQRKTQFEQRASGSDIPTIYSNRIQSGNLGIGGALTNVGGAVGNIVGDLTDGALNNSISNILNRTGLLPTDNLAAFSLGFARTIYRTTDTVALYMPDTLAFQQDQGYDTYSPIDSDAGMALVGALTAGASAIDMHRKGIDNTQIVKNLSPFVARYLTSKLPGSLSPIGFAAVTGLVQNPMLELIYSSPSFRSFQFRFMFYPRSEHEALQVQNLIERLRFHQSPEIYKDSYGFFLVPPSEFDIKFYYNGYENRNIPRISTCVLENLSVDYAPDGFSAYELPGVTVPTLGGTGMPVGIALDMTFKETEYLTKENYTQV